MANKSRNKARRQLATGSVFVGENKRAALKPKGRMVLVTKPTPQPKVAFLWRDA